MTGRRISIRPVILRPRRRLLVTPGCLAVLAAACLVTPREVFFSVLLAAALHEGGHLLAMRCFRVPVESVTLGAFGAQINARGLLRLPYGQELVVTLAGPMVNLLLAPLIAALSRELGWQEGWIFAGAHAILGGFNLLPILPLDGGQALYLLAAWRFDPLFASTVTAVVGAACALTLLALSLVLMVRGGGAFFLFAALGLAHGALGQLALAKNAVRV